MNLIQVDRLEDELVHEQEKYKSITEELEQTFAEMSGYQFYTFRVKNEISCTCFKESHQLHIMLAIICFI